MGEPKSWEFKFLDRKPSTVSDIGSQGSPHDDEMEMNFQGNDPVFSTTLYKSMRPFLIFGRILGIVPLQGLLQDDVKRLEYKKFDWGVPYNILVSISMGFCVVVSIVSLFDSNNKSVPKIVWASNPVIFYSMGLFGYFYLLKNAVEFIALLRTWDELKLSFRMIDIKLRRDINLLFGLLFISAILENMLQQLIQLLSFDLSGNGTDIYEGNLINLRGYFERTKQPNWSHLFEYNPVLSIFMFLWNKFCIYSWNYSDLLIILFTRASYFKFKSLVQYTEDQLTKNQAGLYDMEKWQVVTKDFDTLYNLLVRLNQFLSPLVFISYGVNLFFITIHIHMGLTPVGFNNTATNIYRTWSFFQLCSRMSIITLFASRINDYAEEFALLLSKCPNCCYSISVRRAEKFIKATKLGVHGLNCFVVIKPFMLSLVSVVLTFEIVLLQASGFSYF